MSVSATLAWESDYIFRGVRLADEYFAPSIDISYGDFYAGIWAALPVESMKADGYTDQNEIDYYAGYGFTINETISADVGFTYYTYPETTDEFFDSGNTLEVYTGLSFEAPLSPAIYAFYDLDLEAFTLELSGGHTVELTEASSVEISAYVGYVDPKADGMDYLYYGAGASYTQNITENFSASVGVNYYGSEEAMEHDGSKNKVTLTAKVSAGF